MRRSVFRTSVFAVCLMAWPAAVHAEDVAGDEPVAAVGDESPHRVHHNGLVAFRLNPLGLFSRFEVGYRHALFQGRDGVLFQDTWAGISLVPTVTPAFGKLGVLVAVKPLAVLELSASYERVGYFGTFDLFQSFPSPGDDHHDGIFDERDDHYGTSGQQISLSGRLQAKVGPIAVRNTTNAHHFVMNLREGDTVFYDITLDVLAPGRGFVIANDFDLLYVGGGQLVAGIRFTSTHALYGDGENPNTPTHRGGPILVYTFSKNPGARFNEPSLLLIANWWTSHRYRTGQAVSQAMPYFVLGFTYNGDLL